MVHVITLLKRKQGLSFDEFDKYWEEKHGPLALQQHPQIIRYVQNHVLSLPSGEQAYDGVAECWWPDLDTFLAAVDDLQSGRDQAELEDLERFVDVSQMVSIVTEEKVLK
jgi:uncharacterized protein (TIGR02118 family)